MNHSVRYVLKVSNHHCCVPHQVGNWTGAFNKELMAIITAIPAPDTLITPIQTLPEHWSHLYYKGFCHAVVRLLHILTITLRFATASNFDRYLLGFPRVYVNILYG